jgi:hypothetical protein
MSSEFEIYYYLDLLDCLMNLGCFLLSYVLIDTYNSFVQMVRK